MGLMVEQSRLCLLIKLGHEQPMGPAPAQGAGLCRAPGSPPSPSPSPAAACVPAAAGPSCPGIKMEQQMLCEHFPPDSPGCNSFTRLGMRFEQLSLRRLSPGGH